MAPPLSPADYPELDALLAACADNPDDRTVRLVLADWLREHDDPRAELYSSVGERNTQGVDAWLRQYGDWWPGPGSGLKWLGGVRPSSLGVEWRGVNADQDLLERGWVTDAHLRGDTEIRSLGNPT